MKNHRTNIDPRQNIGGDFEKYCARVSAIVDFPIPPLFPAVVITFISFSKKVSCTIMFRIAKIKAFCKRLLVLLEEIYIYQIMIFFVKLYISKDVLIKKVFMATDR